MSAPQQPTLEEFISQLQNEIILGCNNSQQRSLAVFNKLGEQLQQAINMVTKEQQESKRLRALCEKNKIDYSIPEPTPQVAPPNNTPPGKKK